MHVPLPQNQKKHNNDAVTVKHFQAANHAFCSQDSEDYYQSISSTYSAISGRPVWKHCLNPTVFSPLLRVISTGIVEWQGNKSLVWHPS